jgi:hypothetical protein
MLGNIRRTIEELINYDIIAKEDKRIEQLEHMEKQLVEDAYDLKNLAKLWGTDIKPGAWRAIIQKYRVIITRSRNLARLKSADNNKELTIQDVDREAAEVEKREAELAAK